MVVYVVVFCRGAVASTLSVQTHWTMSLPSTQSRPSSSSVSLLVAVFAPPSTGWLIAGGNGPGRGVTVTVIPPSFRSVNHDPLPLPLASLLKLAQHTLPSVLMKDAPICRTRFFLPALSMTVLSETFDSTTVMGSRGRRKILPFGASFHPGSCRR